MSPFSILVVYLLVWWLVLFTQLPRGVRGQAEEDDIEPGSEPGAPVKAEMKKKIIRTTLIATALWAMICVIIHFKIINWEDWPFMPDIPEV